MGIDQFVLLQGVARIGTDNAIDASDTRIGLDTAHVVIEITDVRRGQNIAGGLYRQENGGSLTIIEALRQQVEGGA